MPDDLKALAECSFDGLAFPVTRITTEGGHRFAEHEAYLREGADLEPCGRRAYRGTITIPMENAPALVKRYGKLFPTLLFNLREKFRENPIAELAHPELGPFAALMHSWSTTLDAEHRSGVPFEVSYIEHNAEAGLLADADGATSSTSTAVAAQAASADAAMLAYRVRVLTPLNPLLSAADILVLAAVGWTPLTSIFSTQLALLEASALPFTAVSACFRVMLDAVAANLALSIFASASAHAATLALLQLRASTYDLRSRYQPTLSRVRTFTVPETMALWQVAQLVYGDSSKTRLILAANAISNPLAVKAGRVLTILPAD